ncbi:MAG: hypothetical protein MUE30_04850 [Spirosomaceae bacterium]|jgi:hypothetical protein|nr:hypothetical protein [Spirosomataceae bacterium]
MKKLLSLGLLLGCISTAIAQNNVFSPEQLRAKRPEGRTRYLALDTYKIGKVLRHRYFVGDEIVFWTKNQRKKSKEVIRSVTDSSFTFAHYNDISEELDITEIKLQDIHKIRVYRRIPWVTQGAYMLPIAGGVFIFTDTVVYDGRGFKTNLDPKGWLIGGGIAALGVLCARASFPKYRIGKRHRLKVLSV